MAEKKAQGGKSTKAAADKKAVAADKKAAQAAKKEAQAAEKKAKAEAKKAEASAKKAEAASKKQATKKAPKAPKAPKAKTPKKAAPKKASQEQLALPVLAEAEMVLAHAELALAQKEQAMSKGKAAATKKAAPKKPAAPKAAASKKSAGGKRHVDPRVKKYELAQVRHTALQSGVTRGMKEGKKAGLAAGTERVLAQIRGEVAKTEAVKAAEVDYAGGTAFYSTIAGAGVGLLESYAPSVAALPVISTIGVPVVAGGLLYAVAYAANAPFLARMVPGLAGCFGRDIARFAVSGRSMTAGENDI